MPIDQEVFDSQIKMDAFPFPHKGDITLGARNTNYTLGPVMLKLEMKPGAFIPAQVHKNVAEVLLKAISPTTASPTKPGTTLHVKAGGLHGPHTTEKGCRVLVLWTERTSHEAADLSDFTVVT